MKLAYARKALQVDLTRFCDRAKTKSEIRSTKSETNPKLEIQMSETTRPQCALAEKRLLAIDVTIPTPPHDYWQRKKTMTRVYRTTCALAAALSLLGSSLLAAQTTGEKGWTSLFNGKDFAGWKFHLGKEGADNEGTYVIEDGVIICKGRPAGYMYTAKSYGDYTLRFQFAFKKPDALEQESDFRGNSGCLIHMGEKNALGVWPRSIEVQGASRSMGLILPIPRNVKCEHTFDRDAMTKVIKPLGQFNTMEIQVKGGNMDILLNGTMVSTVRNCELTSGPIGFQSEGAETHWKNIQIREE
jgi:hypothetical protein